LIFQDEETWSYIVLNFDF